MSCREDRIELMKDVCVEQSGAFRLHECIDGLHKGQWIAWDGDQCVAVGSEAWARDKFNQLERGRARVEPSLPAAQAQMID